MEQLLLNATERKEFGKNAIGRLRKEGKIPAVIYGKNEPLHVTLEEKDFLLKFRHISDKTIVPLEINGKKMEILVKDFQHDMVRDKILHIDLYELVRTEEIAAKVPVKLTGSAIGLREGGVVEQALTSIEVKCMARFVPSLITVDTSSLKVGDSLKIADIKTPENVKFVTGNDSVIVSIVLPKTEVAVEE